MEFLPWLMTLSLCATAQDAEFWKSQAQDTLKKALKNKHNTNVAKNVILFLGDGLGIATITASRIYKGQLQGNTGEETVMAYEKFLYTGLIKVADSAGTGTAFLSGVKSKAGTVGLDDGVQYNNCTSQRGAEVTSILHWSQTKGKSTGIVTTTRVTHATVAAAYAHSANRNWEGDYNIDSQVASEGCMDIAYQLVMNNSDIRVILGGGRRFFLSKNETDPELNYVSSYQRSDLDLIKEWRNDKISRKKTHNYVWNTEQFDATDTDNTDYLLGLFESSHMQYEYTRDRGPTGEPSLSQMTKKAIEILRKNTNGFFLLVEGGRIDHAHHATRAARSLLETVAFEEAVQTALDMTNGQETLVVVTADHSHVFTMGGYPTRGNNILGLVDDDLADDDLPYTTLVYGNGPVGRENLTGVDTADFSYRQGSAVPISSETHSGEDVPVYANGPMAHLFTGTHEQNYIAHVMAFASCVGSNQNHCRNNPTSSGSSRVCHGFHDDCGTVNYTLIVLLAFVFFVHS